jgi:hypothetical protein
LKAAECLRVARALAKSLGFAKGGDSQNHGGNPALASSIDKNFGPQEWILDSGSTFDLVGKKQVPEQLRHSARKMKKAVELTTANGPLKSIKESLCRFGSMGVNC